MRLVDANAERSQAACPQRAGALVLRDVLDFSSREVAGLLETTEQAVASALERARATLAGEIPSGHQPPPTPNSPAEQEVLAKLVRAFEASDVEGLVALMTDDVWVRMPPMPLGIPRPRARWTVLLDHCIPPGPPLSVHPKAGKRTTRLWCLPA